MDVSAIIAIIGGIALLVGVFGGGIEAKEIKIPPIHAIFRVIAFAVGVILILVAVITSKPDLLALLPAQPSSTIAIAPPDTTKPLLSDDFSNSSYDGKYDTSLWNCSGCTLGNVSVKQEDNVVRIEADNSSQGLTAQASWLLEYVNYIQGKMNLQSTDAVGGFASLGFGIPTEVGQWQTMCSIIGNQNPAGQTNYGCEVCTTINGQYVCEYTTESFPVDYNSWHTAKIEIAPKTFEFLFYLDDKLIGEHIPTNVNELKGKFLRVFFGVTADKNIVGYFDDMSVQPSK